MKQPPVPPFLWPRQPTYPELRTPQTVVPGQAAKGVGQGAGPPGMGDEPQLFHEPGGSLITRLKHPSTTTLEQLYRVLPEDSWFSPTVTSSNSIQFELGAFTVPENQEFWLYDYEFKIYVQSGIDAGDVIPAEEGRFSGSLGFDVTCSGRRSSNLLYQLDPVPVQVQRQTFDQPPGDPANAAQFNRSSAQSFAATASPGLSLLPVRRSRQGADPEVGPFTMFGKQGDRVSLSCVIFKTISSPITAIEGRMVGYLLHTSLSSALVQRMRPR